MTPFILRRVKMPLIKYEPAGFPLGCGGACECYLWLFCEIIFIVVFFSIYIYQMIVIILAIMIIQIKFQAQIQSLRSTWNPNCLHLSLYIHNIFIVSVSSSFLSQVISKHEHNAKPARDLTREIATNERPGEKSACPSSTTTFSNVKP